MAESVKRPVLVSVDTGDVAGRGPNPVPQVAVVERCPRLASEHRALVVRVVGLLPPPDSASAIAGESGSVR